MQGGRIMAQRGIEALLVCVSNSWVVEVDYLTYRRLFYNGCGRPLLPVRTRTDDRIYRKERKRRSRNFASQLTPTTYYYGGTSGCHRTLRSLLYRRVRPHLDLLLNQFQTVAVAPCVLAWHLAGFGYPKCI